jgi:hypothetical protein
MKQACSVEEWKSGGAGWNRTTKQRLSKPLRDRLRSAPFWKMSPVTVESNRR